MAGENELDRPLLALLDENTARAREAGQVRGSLLPLSHTSLCLVVSTLRLLVAVVIECQAERAVQGTSVRGDYDSQVLKSWRAAAST